MLSEDLLMNGLVAALINLLGAALALQSIHSKVIGGLIPGLTLEENIQSLFFGEFSFQLFCKICLPNT